MRILDEKRVLSTVRLTENQKKVMTRIVASATEKLAAEEISKGRNLVAARDMLVKLGMIEFREGHAALTSDGEQVMKDSNLIDDMGSLTEEGNKFAYEEGQEPMATESLIKQVNEDIKLTEAMMKDLAMKGEEAFKDAMHSEDGAALGVAQNDGDERVAYNILSARIKDPKILAAAMVAGFGGKLEDYLDA